MNLVWAILSGTPWWVFALLAVLVGVGVQQLKPRVLQVPRIAIVPAVFLAWGLIALWTRATIAVGIIPTWLVALAAGARLGWATARLDGLQADRQRGLIFLPSSAATLVAGLTVFAAKYALTVFGTMNPEWRVATAVADMAVSGISAGYFLARVARTLNVYRTSPGVDLAIDGMPRARSNLSADPKLATATKVR